MKKMSTERKEILKYYIKEFYELFVTMLYYLYRNLLYLNIAALCYVGWLFIGSMPGNVAPKGMGFSVQIDQIYEFIQTPIFKGNIGFFYFAYITIHFSVCAIRRLVAKGSTPDKKWSYYLIYYSSYCISGFVFQWSRSRVTTNDLFYSLLLYAGLTLAMKALLSQIDGDVVKIEVHSIEGEVLKAKQVQKR